MLNGEKECDSRKASTCAKRRTGGGRKGRREKKGGGKCGKSSWFSRLCHPLPPPSLPAFLILIQKALGYSGIMTCVKEGSILFETGVTIPKDWEPAGISKLVGV